MVGSQASEDWWRLRSVGQSYAGPRAADMFGGAQPVPRPIVVGVDNVDDQRPAIEWAAIRAHAGGTSLRIVHAYQWPIAVDPFGLAVWLETAPVASALAVVDDAVRHARAVVPGLDVETPLRPTSPAAAHQREGQRAELIVVGRSKRSRFWPWVLTVNDELVRRARGRVVIVDHKEEDFF